MHAASAASAPMADTDIAIVGGGPVGAALALALQGSNLRITVLESRGEHAPNAAHAVPSAREPRPIALSHGSRLLLERLDAWDALTRTSVHSAINHVHVSQRGGFGRMAFSAADAGVAHLGYVFDFNDIFESLMRAAHGTACNYREGAHATALSRDGDRQCIGYTQGDATKQLTARLVVIADGGEIAGLASPKIIDYAQQALTARVRTARPHANVAYERFTRDGPLALLPFGDEMALVWTLTPERAAALREADAATFLAALRESFGGRLGAFTHVTRRACHPLTLRHAAHSATDTPQPGVVTIGNAAQTLHPVAGQGLNLGLRDAWELAQILRTGTAPSLADPALLRRYHAARRIDRYATIAATHGMVRLFSNDFLPLDVARGAGMALLGSVAPARNFIARRMIFGARG